MTLRNQIDQQIHNWQSEQKLNRLRQHDASLWTNTNESHWLGWMDVFQIMQAQLPKIAQLTEQIKKDAFKNVVVLGMGGSSLFPAMIASVFGNIPGYPALHILDSTHPLQILNLEKNIDLSHTLFIVSSKSGSTLESNSLKNYFYTRLTAILGDKNVGNHFIAITDPGTVLEKEALTEQYRTIFAGEPSIGGRFSALSNFGMVPAALMGVNINHFLKVAQDFAVTTLHHEDLKNNPAVYLGLLLGVLAQNGKDKLTLIFSPELAALGGWIEQLIAESIGKQGLSIIPIDEETLDDEGNYGDDRFFIATSLSESSTSENGLAQLEQRGYPVHRIQLESINHLGREIYRWEIATAVAGSILGINPFDQPDVEASKIRAREIASQFEKHQLTDHHAISAVSQGLKLYQSEAVITEQSEIELALKLYFQQIQSDDYFCIAAFIEMCEANHQQLQKTRLLIRDAKKVATALGFGPRFLHSTGQAHKGGRNNGVFLQITADHATDLTIPKQALSFGQIIQAQAQGDYDILHQRNRRICRIHLGKDIEKNLKHLHSIIEHALV